MDKTKLLALVVVAMASFSGFYLFAQRPANGPAADLQTFTLTQAAEGYTLAGVAKSVDVTQITVGPNRQVRKTTNIVTRQNGPMVIFEITEFTPSSRTRTVALRELQIKMIEQTTSEPDRRAKRDLMRGNRCGIPAQAQGKQILGHMAYPRVTESSSKLPNCANCARDRSVRWEAPDLDCAVVAREVYRLDERGQVSRLRQQRTALRIEEGETIADVPTAIELSTYREVDAKEFEKSYLDHFFGRSSAGTPRQ